MDAECLLTIICRFGLKKLVLPIRHQRTRDAPSAPAERPEALLRPLSTVLCSGLAPASEPLSPMVYGRPASPIVCKVSPGLMPIYSSASRTFVLLFRVHSFQMPCGTLLGTGRSTQMLRMEQGRR